MGLRRDERMYIFFGGVDVFMKKTSIIVPVFNGEKYISRCLNSLLSQDLLSSEYEILVINDGSTDQTMNILSVFEKENPQVRVINTTNQGVSSARNLGCKEAQGEYFIFVDADDWIVVDSLKFIYNAVKGNSLDLLVLDYSYFSESGELPREFIYSKKCEGGTNVLLGKDFMRRCLPPVVWGIVYCRAFWDKYHFSFLSIRHEDEELIPKVFYYAERIKFIPFNFYFYYQNRDSFTMNYKTDACLFMVDAMDSLNSFRKKNIKERDINQFFREIIAQKLLSSFKRSIRFRASNEVLLQMMSEMRQRNLVFFVKKIKILHSLLYNYAPQLLIQFYRLKYKRYN